MAEPKKGKEEKMTIYDFHAHVYPEKIAQKAVEGVGNFYNIAMDETGTVDRLLAIGEEAGIDRFVVHSVATGAKQVTSVNDFIAAAVKEHPDKLIGFGTMHADFEDKCAEIERMQAIGLRGVKIHPDSQRFCVDDPRMFEVYDAIQGRMPLLVHCGDYRYDYDNPERVLRVLKEFPKLTFVAAHFGGWSVYDLAVEYLKDTNCYFDCSSAMMYLGRKRSQELMRIYGAERMLFGSDYPMWNPKSELERFMDVDLTEEERELILHENAERILGVR